jgi:parallel beta-helix repeat protein
MNCNDAGIYLSKSPDSQVYNNTVYNAAFGIDVRFNSTAAIINNLVSGPIHNRDGGRSTVTATQSGITAATFAAWFVDPAKGDFALRDGAGITDTGVGVAGMTNDFCGYRRDVGTVDLGPVEYAGGRSCTAQIRGFFATP